MGGRGDDILTGGKGQDDFIFSDTDGKGDDRITDLQTTGPGADDVSIDQEILSTKKAHRGEDTLLTLADGSTILIEGVTKAEWTEYFL